MSASLDIIVVNWNSGSYLRGCLASVRSVKQAGLAIRRIEVIDNASSDDSAENLQFPDLPCNVTRNPQNRGFGAACNQGAFGSTSDYLLFLNPDTVLLADSLAVPITFMEESRNQHVGICGVQLVDERGNVARTCSSFPSPALLCARMLGLDKVFPSVVPGHFLPEEQHRLSQRVDQVIGAFLLIRRDLFERLRGFDERFFVYFEDLDLALRAARAGYDSFYLADARAVHAGGGSTRQARAAALFYNLRSRIQYSWKHFGFFGGAAVVLGTLLLESVARLLRGIFRRSLDEVWETSRAYAKLWRQTARLLLSRS